jgi:hypothetical protein
MRSAGARRFRVDRPTDLRFDLLHGRHAATATSASPARQAMPPQLCARWPIPWPWTPSPRHRRPPQFPSPGRCAFGVEQSHRTVGADSMCERILKPDHPCPCDSGLTIADCSCLPRGMVPLPADTRPRIYSVGRCRGCYAAPLGNCGGDLELEHPVSASVLRAFSKGGRRVVVSNQPWQKPTERRPISIASMGSRVLCASHNRSLSPLDKQAGRLVSNVKAMKDFFAADGTPSSRTHLYNGFDIERWMLKVLCGAVASRAFPGVKNWRPPRTWLRVLYENAPFPRGGGLHVLTRSEWGDTDGSMYVSPMMGTTDGRDVLAGIRIHLVVFDLILLVTRPDKLAHVGRLFHRPRCLMLDDEKGRALHQHFGWAERPSSSGARVRYRYQAVTPSSGDGASP